MTRFGNTSTEELLRRASESAGGNSAQDNAERWYIIQALSNRVYPAIIETCIEWCMSSYPHLRCLAADIIGQLGFGASRQFIANSAKLLSGLLSDSNQNVLSSALVALGHLREGDLLAISALVIHESAKVRHAVAYCLGTRDEALARQALITLSKDPDIEVRNWATFALGSLSGVDSPAIREALHDRLSDPDKEIRGEALLGLATRHDERALKAVLDELKKSNISSLVVEAAGKFPNEVILPALNSLKEAKPYDVKIEIVHERCRTNSQQNVVVDEWMISGGKMEKLNIGLAATR